MSAASDRFAETGSDLLRLAAATARATQGRFDGADAPVLAAARAYAEAAANGFAALAARPGLSEPERLAAGRLARGFREALGTLASRFAGGDTVVDLSPLGDPATAQRLAAYFDAPAPPVSVSAPAREALDALRRDPLALVTLDTDALLGLMAQVAAGVKVTAA